MDSPLPNHRVVRCCRNCMYYKANGTGERGRANGKCKLPTKIDPTAPWHPTHATTVCDAHIWKNLTNHGQRINHITGAETPDA